VLFRSGLYHAADRLGLRFVRHYDKYAQPRGLPNPSQA
jgi:hypothetical protein